ncbi:hypothetical protein BGX30_006420, partial [Mortierella sp. GBA39]
MGGHRNGNRLRRARVIFAASALGQPAAGRRIPSGPGSASGASFKEQHDGAGYRFNRPFDPAGCETASDGDAEQSGQRKAKADYRLSKQQVKNHQMYQSPSFKMAGKQYFVIAEPSAKSNQSVIALMNQKILLDVENHQKKNLRLIPYPREGKFKVESVHADTLRDLTVKTGHDNENASHFYENEIVVRFRQDPSPDEMNRIKGDVKAESARKLGYAYVFRSSTMDYSQLKYQWNLPAIETNQGWDLSKGSNDVIVGIVDTGADINHPDLQGQLLSGYNVVDPGSDPLDDVGHGTHVAGIIGAVVNNNEGVAGISWYNKILPVKALDKSGSGTTYSVSEGIIWAADHGAKVINLSLGNYADSQFLHDAVRYAYDKDVVLVSAAGNDNTERPGFPAAYPEVLAVAATDANMKKASYSNYGDYID